MHNVRISEWILRKWVISLVVKEAVLHSQLKDALCLLKIVIKLYVLGGNRFTRLHMYQKYVDRFIGKIQSIDQYKQSGHLKCHCWATSRNVNKRLKSVFLFHCVSDLKKEPYIHSTVPVQVQLVLSFLCFLHILVRLVMTALTMENTRLNIFAWGTFLYGRNLEIAGKIIKTIAFSYCLFYLIE